MLLMHHADGGADADADDGADLMQMLVQVPC